MLLPYQIIRAAHIGEDFPFLWTRQFHRSLSSLRRVGRVNRKFKCPSAGGGGGSGGTMSAILWNHADKSVKLTQDQPKPGITGPDDVLVKVAFAGVCGTDLHIMKGEFPVKEDGPVVLGHEFSGVVEDVGKKVKMFKKGQNVVIDPNRLCSLCEPCRLGKYQYCADKAAIGLFRHGGWAQYVTVPQQQVFALPENVTLEQGALCEPFSCVWHGFDRASPMPVGQKILVIGAGIIGTMWICGLHLQGHRNVTVTEVNESRLNIIKNLETGFRLVHPDCLVEEKPVYDVIIDCTGHGKVWEVAFSYMNLGGKYVLFGCAPPTHKSSLTPFDVFNKELTVIGVKVNPFAFPHALGWLSAMGNRYLDYSKIGIEIFKLSELQAAIEKLQKGQIAKAILAPNGGGGGGKC